MASEFLIIVVAGVAAMLAATGLTPVARKVARAVGAVDAPGARRMHDRTIPRMGGLAIALAYAGAVGLVVATEVLTISSAALPGVLGFAAGAVLIFFVGLFDDVRSLGAKKKLLGQVAAATLAWLGGARVYEVVNVPGLGAIDLGPVVAYLATLVWILAFTNAINLIDGLDGLAGGVVFFAAVTNIIVALITDNSLALGLNAALAGSVLGFLFYNFNPARIFMGDTGSLFLGYALGASALLSSRQKESTLASLLVPIIALGVPLTDTILAMFRRVLERRSIFSADRKHLHHRLLDSGLTHRRAVLALYACSVALSGIAVLAAFGKDWQLGASILAAILVLLGIIRFSHYFEGVLGSRGRGRAYAEAAVAVRRALREFGAAAPTAPDAPAVLSLAQGLFPAEFFAFATLTPAGAEQPLWTLPRSSSAGRREGRLFEHELAIRLAPAPAAPATLRVGCVVPGGEVPIELRLLLDVVGDTLETQLQRVGAGALTARPTRERLATFVEPATADDAGVTSERLTPTRAPS